MVLICRPGLLSLQMISAIPLQQSSLLRAASSNESSAANVNLRWHVSYSMKGVEQCDGWCFANNAYAQGP